MNKVNILLATYRPNMIFFEKQLLSLNIQTYKNIEILIRDDSASDEHFDKIVNMVKKSITNFNFVIYRNEKNLGSNKTFELLTKDASADYVAFCDQDDIWKEDKIFKLVEKIEEENAVLCYSDLSVINSNDEIINNSFRDINKRVKHLHGNNLFKYFLNRNSVTGCSMIMKTIIAKQAIPFCDEFYVHDHWLTLFAASRGLIAYFPGPLILYRIHDNNQIGASLLNNISSKEDYFNFKLLKEAKKYEALLINYEFEEMDRKQIIATQEWTNSRIDFFKRKSFKSAMIILKSARRDWQLILFELFINLAPAFMSKIVIKKIKTNK